MATAPTKTVLALDVGEQRIGIAIATLIAKLPSPLTTLQNSPKAAEQIAKLVKQHSATALVIGLPRNLQGDKTQQTNKVEDFGQFLQTQLTIPIYWQDEALTTKKAKQELMQRGVLYNKGTVDALAATYILEDFLHDHQDLG